jgi:hypothetical protein
VRRRASKRFEEKPAGSVAICALIVTVALIRIRYPTGRERAMAAERTQSLEIASHFETN